MNKAKFIPLLAVDNPRDLTLEALRSLRTSLQVTLCTSVNNIIAILGISPGVGKSFVSANFAYVLAQAGKRTLLIDGDIRRGHLQNYFETTRTPGLTELINQKATLEDVLRKTPEDNLTFLPAGTFPTDPAELLMSNRFKELMTTFSQMFDLVVIDTAPILAVTDGALIGAQAGTNFLVLGSNSHQPEEIEVAMKQLTNAGIKLNGSIYNHTKPEPKIYGNSRYNYYYDYNKTE